MLKCACGECEEFVKPPSKFKQGHNSKIRKLSKQHKINIGIGVTGEHNTFWNGGKSETWNGYLQTRVYNHPFSNKKHKGSKWGYIRTHRLVVEQYLSKKLDMTVYLGRSIIIHHKNGNKHDNRIENLELMTISQHMRLHGKQRNRKKPLFNI